MQSCGELLPSPIVTGECIHSRVLLHITQLAGKWDRLMRAVLSVCTLLPACKFTTVQKLPVTPLSSASDRTASSTSLH